ncbi:hypothetical protein DBA29_21095 [Xenophilus aerolatus]|nr:hypothetical protein [Xenophilus aerolatus]
MAAPRFTSLDEAAFAVLDKILVTSVNSRIEYGGMLYSLGGLIYAQDPVTQYERTTVNVGHRAPNCGCPPGSIPMAYYHTHPIYSIGKLKGEYNVFSDDDIEVAKSVSIDAYVGTLDGTFLHYDRVKDKVFTMARRLRNSE